MTTVARFDSLVNVALHYLNMDINVGVLTRTEGAIPEGEVRVKTGGDRGGKALKLVLQIANVVKGVKKPVLWKTESMLHQMSQV